MDADLSNIQFNKNQRTDSAAIGVISATRILLVALVLNIAWVVAATLPSSPAFESFAAIAPYATVALAFAAFCCGAYGVFSLAESLGWKGYISAAIIIGFLIPYVRIVLVIVMIAKGMSVVAASQYRFSLFGLVKRAA